MPPKQVRALFNRLTKVEYIRVNEEMMRLANLYIKEGALKGKSISDAQHIAVATLSLSTALISWNFKDILNFVARRQYNATNLREGYPIIDIISPDEVVYE